MSDPQPVASRPEAPAPEAPQPDAGRSRWRLGLPRRDREGRGLSSQVLWRIMPLTLVSVTAIWLSMAFLARSQQMHSYIEAERQQLEAAAKLASVNLDDAVFSARSVAQNAITIGALYGQDIDRVVRPFLQSLIIGSDRVAFTAIVDFTGEVIVSTAPDNGMARTPHGDRWIADALEGEESFHLVNEQMIGVFPIRLGASTEGALVMVVPNENLLSDLHPSEHAPESRLLDYFIVATAERSDWPEVRLFSDGLIRGSISEAIPSAPSISIVSYSARTMPSITDDPVQALLGAVFLIVLGIVVLGIHMAVKRITDPIRQLVSQLEEHGLDLAPLPRSAPIEIRALAQRFTQAGEDVAEALRTEKSLSAQQRQFVSMVSHEFRTPLSIIDAGARGLEKRRKRFSESEIDDRLTKIRSAVSRLIRLMESTLIASKLDAGFTKITEAPVDLRAMIGTVVDEFALIASGTHIARDVDSAPDTFLGDEALIYSLLNNLLSNAIKYSPNEPEIAIRCEARGDWLHLAVSDNGVGIPPDEIARIGEKFYRASTSTGIAGTGLGLALAFQIVHLHDGRIEIDSTPGIGTTFSVHLPLDRRKHRANSPRPDAPAAPATGNEGFDLMAITGHLPGEDLRAARGRLVQCLSAARCEVAHEAFFCIEGDAVLLVITGSSDATPATAKRCLRTGAIRGAEIVLSLSHLTGPHEKIDSLEKLKRWQPLAFRQLYHALEIDRNEALFPLVDALMPSDDPSRAGSAGTVGDAA